MPLHQINGVHTNSNMLDQIELNTTNRSEEKTVKPQLPHVFFVVFCHPQFYRYVSAHLRSSHQIFVSVFFPLKRLLGVCVCVHFNSKLIVPSSLPFRVVVTRIFCFSSSLNSISFNNHKTSNVLCRKMIFMRVFVTRTHSQVKCSRISWSNTHCFRT